MNLNTPASPKPTSWRTLILLASVFFLPFLVGSALYWLDWRPAGFSNRGELLQPPRVLPATGLTRIDGTPLPTSELLGKWLLSVLITDVCNEDCQVKLTQMRQIHLALGKEQKRAQPVLFITAQARRGDDVNLKKVTDQFPDMLIAVVQPDNAQQWQSSLDSLGALIHVVDPFGNVMMRYGTQVAQRDVLKDVERLLKYSWVR